MATVDELARDIVGSLGLSSLYLISAQWVNNRYKEMVSKVRFKHLRKIGEVQIPATYDIGTLSVTRGSTAVTGVGTAWETNIGSGSQEYWYIKPSSAWYKIASVTDETNLVLTTAFSEDTIASANPQSYKTVKRYHALDSSARWVGDFVLSRLRLPLGNGGRLVPLEQLDREAPGRILTDQFPRTGAQIGVDSNGCLMVEFYPYSAKSEIIHYVYWDLPSDLSIGSTIPTQIDPYVLKEGALVDVYRRLKADARNAGNVDISNSWRNDEFAQSTKWQKAIQDAVRTDQGNDDRTFILSMYGGRHGSGDIRTAHDQVASNWSYPN